MSDLLAAEWLKLRTTRLLVGMLPTAMALSMLAVAGTSLVTARSDVGLESDEGLRRILSVTGTGALVVLLLGMLISAGEYRHGTAGDTFLTTPRGQRVVGAKLAVGAAVGVAAGIGVALGSLGAAAGVYALKDASFPLGDALLWGTLAGAVVYSILFAALGVAVGTLVRNQVPIAVTRRSEGRHPTVAAALNQSRADSDPDTARLGPTFRPTSNTYG